MIYRRAQAHKDILSLGFERNVYISDQILWVCVIRRIDIDLKAWSGARFASAAGQPFAHNFGIGINEFFILPQMPNDGISAAGDFLNADLAIGQNLLINRYASIVAQFFWRGYCGIVVGYAEESGVGT